MIPNLERKEVRICFPEIKDIEQILNVQKSVLLKNKNSEPSDFLGKKGFLVNEVTK